MKKRVFFMNSKPVDEYAMSLAVCKTLASVCVTPSEVDIWFLTFGDAHDWAREEFDNQRMSEMIADNLRVTGCPTVYSVYIAGSNDMKVVSQMVLGTVESQEDCDMAVIANMQDSIPRIINNVLLFRSGFSKYFIFCESDCPENVLSKSVAARLLQVLKLG